MKKQYSLMTDSCCDLPLKFLKEREIEFVSMMVTVDGKEYIDDLGETFDTKWYIEELRNEKVASTSQVNVGIYYDKFESFVKSKTPLLYLCFSSGLSGSYNNALTAKNMLIETYGEIDVTIVDTQAACLGLGLLVRVASDMQQEGKSLLEVEEWVESHKSELHSWVTVDDLAHLQRGGRISKTAAVFGSMLNIKPIIVVDSEGKLVAIDKVRGRKKSIEKVANETYRGIQSPDDQIIYIAYAGDIQAAERAKSLLESQIHAKEICILPMGPTISTHTGYGALALFSFGTTRR